MNRKSFFTRLSIVTLGASAVLALAHQFIPALHPHGKFAIATILLFLSICVGLYFAGARAIQSKSKFAFTNLVSASVFGKILLGLGLLLAYQQSYQPSNEWFVGIFLWCYGVFTAFEVWFMTRIAKG